MRSKIGEKTVSGHIQFCSWNYLTTLPARKYNSFVGLPNHHCFFDGVTCFHQIKFKDKMILIGLPNQLD